ncbi:MULTISPECIES: non-ribosomal peptide synthetase [unclassified Brevibacillus]|uniref:non-ribosomal peptide synthetase n=1 Tax=unclassified Brevibacillus TaxID=2684853 RepID=UPI00156AC2A3|nr:MULTISPECIES: non-ribosomal peptide synthetase [unclassified Brevibacillus]NRQ55289.1 amino acid adenylation domain-containing protein [Brevibacillus sp. HD1.4A]UED66655.1 amino acid adenylation domain-containing protein [Brevibacillus sp. HD3.3A]
MNNIDQINALILESVKENRLDKELARKLLHQVNAASPKPEKDAVADIAIIGISCRLPFADNLEQYWTNLLNGTNGITDFPLKRRMDTDPLLRKLWGEPHYAKGSYLEEIDRFDAEYFRISPREAEFMDPHQRLLLEVTAEAIEDAGYMGEKIDGTDTGVFIGRDHHSSGLYQQFIDSSNELAMTGNLPSFLSGRIAFFFNLFGPNMVIDTACSSGLVAVHHACESLRKRECRLAIAGGISLNLVPMANSSFKIVENSDGIVRPFDSHAKGTTWGEGLSVILLKPLHDALQDKDRIYAVIKASGVNSDGASNYITAPNPQAQEQLLTDVWTKAGIHPETISYIETHGTGTVIGDPIEVKAMKQAFQPYTRKKQFCGIGSVKSNIGHLVGASGMASLLKVVLSLKHKQLVPTINFAEPNPYIPFSDSPFYLVDRPLAWETGGVPRRAGISSFGFSGMNCHVLLEEWNQQQTEKNEQETPRLFTLSAKSRANLSDLLRRYCHFLQANQQVDFSALVYTAQVGREHFSHRLAIIARNTSELLQKIAAIMPLDLDNLPETLGYYGQSASAWKAKNHLLHPDTVDKANRPLHEKANQLLYAWAEQGSLASVDSLRELATSYVQGARIHWTKLYEGQAVQTIELPVYPFSRVRHWPTPTDERTADAAAKGQLPGECVLSTSGLRVYAAKAAMSELWMLQEHRILGNGVLPGAAYLEMAGAASKAFFAQQGVVIKNVSLSHMLSCSPDETRIVHTIVQAEHGHVRFTIASRDESDPEASWITHATGEVHPLAPRTGKTLPIASIIREMEQQDAGKFAPLYSGLIQYGPRWRGIEQFYENDRAALLHIRLADEREQGTYSLHPASLDTALSFWHLLRQNEAEHESYYFPFYYQALHLYTDMPASFYSYLRKREARSDSRETVSYDISLIDEQGNVFAEVENYTLKRVSAAMVAHDLFYQIRWVKAPLEQPGEVAAGSVLLFGNSDSGSESGSGSGTTRELIQQWEARGVELIQVAYGDSYRKEQETKYVVGDAEADYQQLFADLQERGINRIVHAYALDEHKDAPSLSRLQTTQARTIQSLFFTVKSLVQAKYKQDLELVVLGRNGWEVTGAEKALEPCHTALFQLGKVVNAEYPHVKCHSIDLDDETECGSLLAEIYGESAAYQVAYRGNQRYVEEFARCPVEESVQPFELQEDGLYLITGGTGGIGLEIAKHLASRKKIRLGLLSRSGLPPRADWEAIKQKSSEADSKTRRIIEAVEAIERSGSSVTVCACDIADEQQVATTFQQLREAYGAVKGVIHAAGVAGSGFLFTKTWAEFAKVTQPKIEGSYLLHRLLEERPDFFVLFSSIATVEGSPGQSDYAAANGYLDGFASCLRQQGIRATTINWTAWAETGMAADYGVTNGNALFKPLKTAQAVQAFASLPDVPRVVVADIRFEQIAASLGNRFPLQLASELRGKVAERAATTAPGEAFSSAVPIVGKQQDELTETEKQLAQVWAKTFGLAEIDLQKSFYEVGGDSIMATQMANLLNTHLNKPITIAEVFEFPTIPELAAYLDENLLPAQETPASQEATTEQQAGHDLSKAQYRIWFLQNYDPHTTAYHLPVIKQLKLDIDLDVLQQSLDMLTRRHASLRTVIKMVDGVPKQFVLPEWQNVIQFSDYQQESSGAAMSARRLEEHNATPFDFEQPLFRMELHRLADDEHRLCVSMHHIISDGWSVGLFFRELMELYESIRSNHPVQLPAVSLQYGDWVEQEKKWLASAEFRNMERYWMSELAKPLPVLNLPTDFERPHSLVYDGSYIKFTVSKEKTEQLRLLARNRSTTLYMTVLAVYFLFLHKISQEEDIIVGFPVSGRERQEWENVIGLFMNMVCIRVDFRGLSRFDEVLETIKHKCVKAYANGRYPFNTLVEKLNPERDQSRTPVFSTIFQLYDNVPQDNDRISLYDLSCICKMEQEQMEVRMEYKTTLFAEETIRKYVDYFSFLIDQVIDNPTAMLGRYELLDAKHKAALLEKNPQPVALDAPGQVHRLFAAQAQKNPAQTAVVFEGRSLTYQQLDERSNQLAALLTSTSGQESQEPIGVYMPRGIEMIVALLGILKAGRPYVPLDVDFPHERIAYMIQHSEIKTVLTEQSVMANLETIAGTHLETVVDLSEDAPLPKTVGQIRYYGSEHIRAQPVTPVTAPPAELMYIMYTSGSTGTPKGVMVTQQNVIHYLLWSQQQFQLGPARNMMLVTSISFDISVFEIFGCLTSGATLHVLSPERLRDPALLFSYLEEQRIDVWHSVPTLISQFILGLSQQDEQRLACLRQFATVLVGGEAWSPALAKDISSHFPNAKLYNLYGPTEATIWATCCEVNQELKGKSVVPLGRPLGQNQVYILDKDGNLCGPGVPGEICISGPGVTPGYFRDSEKTAQVYRFHPFADQLVYHTGDLGKYGTDGQLEYISRNDGLVKVRGYRIETGEIEQRIASVPGVTAVCVVAVKESESNKLIGYYTSTRDIAVQEFQDALRKALPAYMIPARFVRLEAMPVTSNQKLDRKTLQAMSLPADSMAPDTEQGELHAPSSDVEKFLLQLWRDLLRLEQIGTRQNFFDLGGNSHLIVQMQARIEEKYPQKIKVIDLFECKTISAMAQHIERSSSAQAQPGVKKAGQPSDIDNILQLLDDFSEGEASVEDILKKLGE